MDNIILYGFILVIVGGIARMVYEVQQNKKKDKEIDAICEAEADAELKDKFQILAGIKPYDSQKGTNDLADVLMKAEQITKDGFPPESESIPVQSFPITKIKFNEDTDPLSDIPLSRVSKETKKKMAEIAKQDISRQLEAEFGPVIDFMAKDVLAKSKPKKSAPKKKATKKPKTNE